MALPDPHADNSSEELPAGVSIDHFYQLIMIDRRNLKKWLAAFPPADREKLEKLAQERRQMLEKSRSRKRAGK
jgi:GTP1/Obg family GTP-binding protein